MKEREKCKKTSHYPPQCAKWFSRYSISKSEFGEDGYRHFVGFQPHFQVQYLRSLLFDLFETLQAVRAWQRNSASFQILLLWQPESKLLSIIEKTKGLLFKQK